MESGSRRTIAGSRGTPSIKDVAAAAGVSFQTASKVLNNKGSVSVSTRERIVAAAAELGYVPNALARSLTSTQTHTIGVITSDFSDTTLAQPIVGIEREAHRRGLCAIIGSVDEVGSDFQSYLRVLIERRVDGIILNVPVLERAASLERALENVSVPVVALHGGGGPRVSVVSADDYHVAYLAVQHLVSLGHRRIAMVTGPNERDVVHLRSAAYRDALTAAGVEIDEQLVVEADWQVESGYQAAHGLLDSGRSFTAVYAHNDMMATGVLAACYDRGITVPTQCSVVGCDDLPMSGRTIPPLTTVRIPFVDIGEEALRMLERHIEDDGEPERVALKGSLVFRSSTAPSR